jgi:hypothetical protein
VGIRHLNVLGQSKGLLLVNIILVPLPCPSIALRLIKVMRILILIQTRRGREKGFSFLFTSSNFLRLTEHS